MSSKSTFLAFLIVLILFSGESLFADWYKDYSEALKRIEKKEWQDAVVRLQSALRESDDETAIAQHVRTKVTYFPHFYLGLAYYNLKMYEAAVSEFEKSEKDGAIHSRSTLELQMSILKRLALEQIAKSAPANKEPPAPTNEVHQPPKTDTPPSPVPPAADVEPVKPHEELPASKTTSAPVDLKPEAPASKPTPVPLDLKPEAPAIAADTALRDKLKQGARQYFEGNFDGAIASMKSILQMDTQNASANFLLGCAYASKYLLAPENRQLLNKASDAFRKSKKINPQFENSAYMSPAVLNIYQRVR